MRRPIASSSFFPHSLAVGAQFGVIIVMEDATTGTRAQVEVATFRSDVGYSDGRHPDRSGLCEIRRKKTSGGATSPSTRLLLDPETSEVLDFVGGREDLSAGIIRAIGHAEERFREDKLRMLRAVRFAARFGYAIEPETFRRDSEARAGNSAGFRRAHSRRTDQVAHRRRRAARLRTARRNAAAAAKCCPKLRG